MLHAVLICSDEACAARYEAYGPLVEVAALACECGCALEVIGWPDAPLAAAVSRADRLELTPLAA